MHHNWQAYWRHLQSLQNGHPDRPSPRVCRLLAELQVAWKRKPKWLREDQVGHLHDLPTWRSLGKRSVMFRKAHAVKRMLEIVTDPKIADSAGTCSVHPDELIVGTLPPFSVGQGKEFVRYLTDDEKLGAMLQYLNETSPMGHVVPDHGRLLEKGLAGLIADCKERQTDAAPEGREFYEAVIICLNAVNDYAQRYAAMAKRVADAVSKSDPHRTERRAGLATVAANLRHAPWNPPQTFHQAVQAIFILHCAFHWTVEIVPLGRLDQLLQPFLTRDLKAGRLTLHQAQEILDCLWIKFDEKVILSSRLAEDRFNSCDGNLTGYFGSSNFDQGGLLNQWMQQVTIGGVRANDAKIAEDATNDLTYLFLNCARRLPLNSPTLDLRIHSGTPKKVLREAARSLLSGGAHPVILSDTRILKALDTNTLGKVPKRSLRNYACDGCYETMFAGETEFSFGFIFALDAIERTLNQGAKFTPGTLGAPLHLRGNKDSWRTKEASQIKSFDEFWEIFTEHLLLSCHRYIASLLGLYGSKLSVAPSPLLSAFLGGCLERGRDINAGGTNFHLFSPLIVGTSNAADSLHAIRELVFGRAPAFSLDELLTCLRSNWGKDSLVIGNSLTKDRMTAIRALCLEQSKCGHGDRSVDVVLSRVLETFVTCVNRAWNAKSSQTSMQALRDRNGLPELEIHLAPGAGTFEQYVLLGGFSGASADGRYAEDPIASDLSPAPLRSDEEPIESNGSSLTHRRRTPLQSGIRSYNAKVLNELGDGAAVDFNLPEDFSETELAILLEEIAAGRGPSVATFTVADPATLTGAQSNAAEHELVRVRMGGWTEFFVSLLPIHQAQHRRRPLFVGKGKRA